jgi:phage tail sheath protein FI
LASGSSEREQAHLYQLGVNPLRCQRGRGVMLWGGRTVVEARQEPEHVFIAHRRLVHRLVRGFRRVAEPLVFETNGPVLWLAVARAMTALLVEVWRGGGLRGERAEEAFFVHCDGKTNTPESIETGACLCEVGIAPAAPMEFITIRIALRRDGTLELQ